MGRAFHSSDMVRESRRLGGMSLLFSRINIAFLDRDVFSSGHITRLRQLLSSEFQRDLYGLAPAEVMSRYGRFVLLGYPLGHKSIIRTCFVPAGLLSRSGKPQNVLEVLDRLERRMKYLPSADGGRLYYEIETLGLEVPEESKLSKDATAEGWDPNIWYKEAISTSSGTILNDRHPNLERIYRLIEEDNLKAQWSEATENEAILPAQLEKPVIEIGRVWVGSRDKRPVYDVAAVLKTRYGVPILLSHAPHIEGDDVVLFSLPIGNMTIDPEKHLERLKGFATEAGYRKRVDQLYSQVAPIFKCEIRTLSFDHQPIFTVYDQVARQESEMALCGYDDRPYRYSILRKNGKLYICNEDLRRSLSIYTFPHDGDRNEHQIIEQYGIKEWIGSLEEGTKRGSTVLAL